MVINVRKKEIYGNFLISIIFFAFLDELDHFINILHILKIVENRPIFYHIFFSLNPSLPFLILPMTRRDSSPARPPVTDQNITGLNQPAQSRQSEHKHIFQLFRIPIITTILPFISEVEEVVAVVVIVRIASDLV